MPRISVRYKCEVFSCLSWTCPMLGYVWRISNCIPYTRLFLNVLAFECCLTRVEMMRNERREEFWNLIFRTPLCELCSLPCARGEVVNVLQGFLCRANELTCVKSHNSPPREQGLCGLSEAAPDASALLVLSAFPLSHTVLLC